MKWTSRDTAYLATIAILVCLLSALVFEVGLTRHQHGLRQPVISIEGSELLDNQGAGLMGASKVDGYLVKEVPVTQRQPILVTTAPVEIDDSMTPEEAAAAIGIRVDQLPPRLVERLESGNSSN